MVANLSGRSDSERSSQESKKNCGRFCEGKETSQSTEARMRRMRYSTRPNGN